MNSPPLIPAPIFQPPSMEAAIAVLQKCNWPTDIVVIDFETYFTAEYSLEKLSTIEYIESPKFEEQGVACLIVHGESPYAPRQAAFWPNVEEQLLWLQKQYGRNLERCTVVIQNARFDGTILVRKHSILPPFVVDTLALSRHLDARNTHKLKDLCKRWGLPPKGETMKFIGLKWATMTPDQREAYASYANNDAEREADLLAILLPKLTRPEVELPLQRHTLRLYWSPELCFDFPLADELLAKMNQEVEKSLESVAWVLDV